ncbi:hypothetical protein QVD99_005193 [Batrachochytrium dendrobatidis]|nr:hypothetical protein QVD99_005193 [Batrachochytrium dendrobatidis]
MKLVDILFVLSAAATANAILPPADKYGSPQASGTFSQVSDPTNEPNPGTSDDWQEVMDAINSSIFDENWQSIFDSIDSSTSDQDWQQPIDEFNLNIPNQDQHQPMGQPSPSTPKRSQKRPIDEHGSSISKQSRKQSTDEHNTGIPDKNQQYSTDKVDSNTFNEYQEQMDTSDPSTLQPRPTTFNGSIRFKHF